MRLTEPLTGIRTAGNHWVVHLALLLAQPACNKYYESRMCKDGDTSARLLSEET